MYLLVGDGPIQAETRSELQCLPHREERHVLQAITNEIAVNARTQAFKGLWHQSIFFYTYTQSSHTYSVQRTESSCST